ncbi:MAG TPA: glycosyltransferase family 4 protein [Pseudonocardiaceae bacterium]|nr:glycosyltransferase family 4 protein [Pseudonocardiaceae bacterium]
MRIGFACAWDPVPEPTWSYTPWHLRGALRDVAEVVDMGLTYPTSIRIPLKALHARRVGGRWVSMWKHGVLARGYAQHTLRAAERRSPLDVVVQIQDLTRLRTPYLIYQDLSYGVLLDELVAGPLVHFPSLTKSDASRLRDRQHEIYEGAAGILAMSHWFARHLVESEGVPADKVHVVHPGASAATSDGSRTITARPGPRRRLLLVGKDFHTKAGDQVLAALAVLRREVDPAITLTVAGPKEWPTPDGPPAGVDFRGRLPLASLAALYAEHDLFVMPSRFEGFGIALVEALSHGLPCVARNAYAMPEIVRPGVNGDLVDTESPDELAKVIAAVLDDDGVYATTARQSDEVRGHYTWQRAARDVLTAAGNAIG